MCRVSYASLRKATHYYNKVKIVAVLYLMLLPKRLPLQAGHSEYMDESR